MKFGIIIPAKNEEHFLRYTLESIVNQSVIPETCLIINDGSTDKTPEIIETYKKKHPFIYSLDSTDKPDYVLGQRIVELFHRAIEWFDKKQIEYNYLFKMDADVRFGEDLFERIRKKLENEKYGICSPSPFQYIRGKKKYIYSPLWHTNGDFKVYHKACLKDILPLPSSLGWDCADNILAMEKGWKTEAFRDIHYEQQRPIGKHSKINARKRQGAGAHLLSYPIIYFLLKALHDTIHKPYIIGSLSYIYGYLQSATSGSVKILNKEQQKTLRKKFWESFFYRIKNRNFTLLQVFSNKS